jgi:hypothetical protein
MRKIEKRHFELVCPPLLALAFAMSVSMSQASAQEAYISEATADQAQGNPDCPPPVINGITPSNWSCRTGTQGVQDNPNCPPPVIILNGQPTTPRNWSCPVGTPATRNATNGQWDREHPGFPTAAGSTPCQPGGPGGYNWLNNAEGTQLPEGCVRPTSRTIAKSDPHYQTAPPGSYIVPPAGPPGSYIRPEGKPGSYIVAPHGAPGSYLNATKNGTQVHTGPGGAIVLTPSNNESADEDRQNVQTRRGRSNGGGYPYRQDTQAMQGAMQGGPVSNSVIYPYRQDTQAMQGAMQGGGNYGQGNGAGYSYRQDTQAMQGAMQGGTFGNGVTPRKSANAKKQRRRQCPGG